MSSDNPWPGYNEYHVDRDETDPEYRQELLDAFRATGTKPEDIVTDDQLRADYAEYLKKNSQIEEGTCNHDGDAIRPTVHRR